MTKIFILISFAAFYLFKFNVINSILVSSVVMGLLVSKDRKNNLPDFLKIKLELLEDKLQFYLFIFLIVAFSIYFISANYLFNQNYIYSFIFTTAIITVISFSYNYFFKKDKKEVINIKKEFNDLDIKTIKQYSEDIKNELKFFKFDYTIDNSLISVNINKTIALSIARDIKKYLKNNEIDLVTKKLIEKYNINIGDCNNLYEIHKRIIKEFQNLCKNKKVIRVQQLLQYCDNYYEKSFIYFLSQLCSKKFTQYAAQYAVFAIREKFI